MSVNKEAPGAEAADDEKPVVEADAKVEAEATEDEDEGEDAAEGEAESAEGEEGEKKLSKTARKNAKIRAKIATLEEIARHESNEADRLREENKRLRGDVGPAPKETDFADERAYTAALNAYEADKRVTARTQKNTEDAATSAAERAMVSKQNLFRERALALSDRFPDIGARIFDNANPVTPAMAEVIQDSERGPEVAYHLATHREDALRIARMTPLAAAREIGRIEATLDAPKPRTKTNAPPPPITLKGGTATTTKDPDKMSSEEWLVWRETQLGLRRKA